MIMTAKALKEYLNSRVPVGTSRAVALRFVQDNFLKSTWKGDHVLVCTCNSVAVFPVARNWIEVRFLFDTTRLIKIEVLNRSDTWITA
jgi:hypothetical protein